MAEHEILYHGKDKSTGEWIEGYYTKVKWYLDEKEMHIILPVDIVFFPHSEISEWHEVFPETVGQFIGVLDKNKRKIFNGDIVKTKYGRICEVYWFAPKLCWDLRPIECKPKAPDEYDLFASKNLEVIGNVHDRQLIGDNKK